MKKILLNIGLCILVFIVSIAMSFLYLFTFMNVFCRFNLISKVFLLIFSAALSLVFSIFVTIYTIICTNLPKSTKLSNWLAMNWHKFSLYYVISLICFEAIRSEIIFDFNALNNLISLEWTILGISITIFLVWNVLIVNYLKEKKPKEKQGCLPLEKLKTITQKGEFYQNANSLFNAVTLLIINIIVLILASGATYINKNSINLYNQNIAIVSFFFCTNTLIDLFMGVLKPLNEEKKHILDGTKISNKEVSEGNKIFEKTTNLITVMEEINASKLFDEQQKQEIIKKLILEYSGIKLDEQNQNTKEIQTSDGDSK